MKNKTIIFAPFWMIMLSFILTSCDLNTKLDTPDNLTISEGFINPIGFYDNTPSFSWKLPQGIQSQSAYSIVVASSPDLLPKKADLWQTGKVMSDQSIFISYDGKPFHSRQKVYWQVRFWDDKGKASAWSEMAHFELGLLNNNDWQAKWIHIPADELTEKDKRGSLMFRPQYMRKEVSIGNEIISARLYITAKGVFETYINGHKVGDDIMPPGWTPETKSLSTLTYDVTELLKEGENTLGAIVAEGWHSGRINLRSTKKTNTHTPSLLYQLEIETEDGTSTIISDETWKITQDGPIRTSKIYDGETYDAHFELGDWKRVDCHNGAWLKAQEEEVTGNILLLPKRFQGVKNKMHLNAQKITIPERGKPIFDFGQNNVGVPLVKVPMKKGDTLSIRFAEMLDGDGKLYTDNYRSALSTDYYIASSDGVIEWCPTFTFHGYRYVELSGFSPNAKPQINWVKAIVQFSDIKSNGTFTSSHDKLNQLQSNITWGLRSNFFDIPTDCPQRDERLGWTGDAQVIAPTSVFNFDMYAFWNGYLQSVRQEQFENGGIPIVIPNVLGERTSSGWGDVAVIVPWELYQRTGDVEVLETNFEMMKGWVEYYKTKAKGHNFVPKNTSFCDWLQPYPAPKENPGNERRGDTPEDFVNTAYFARSVELTMKSAQALGKENDAEQLSLLHDSIQVAFENKFFDANAHTTSKIETQTQYLLALEFGLLSDKNIPKAIQHLKRVIAECDGHLRTGFLGTHILPLVLDKAGEADLMYDILFKESYPSWFFSINQGATTMWERWDSYTHENGFHKHGMNSFNHYAYGAVGQWLYESVAGIKAIKPGYKEILIAPIPGDPLTSAEASYDSPYGVVSTAWKLENGAFELIATVPSNTSAKIIIPGNGSEQLMLNGDVFMNNSKVKLLEKNEDGFTLKAFPGTYEFESAISTNL